MSLNYTFPESSVAQENNKLPRGPTNSYKCQRDFSNVLCKQQFLLDGASQRSKLYYLTQSFVPNQCSNSSSWSYFMICGPEKAEITKAVLLRNSRNDKKRLAAIFHSLETAKGSVGQTDKLKKEKKERLLAAITHLQMVTELVCTTGLNPASLVKRRPIVTVNLSWWPLCTQKLTQPA